MVRRDDVPQTAGEAVREGWHRLGILCGHCHHKGRVDLTQRCSIERLADIAGKCYCERCGKDIGSRYLTFDLIAVHRSEWRKSIAFSGSMAVKITMS